MPAAPPDPLLIQVINEIMGTLDASLFTVGEAIWPAYAAKALIDPQLRPLYVKRALLDVRLGQEQPSTDLSLANDVSDKQSQRFAHLQTMRETTQAEIVRIEMKARARRPSQSGQLTTVAPEAPPTTETPNANDPRYTGDPYTRPRVVR